MFNFVLVNIIIIKKGKLIVYFDGNDKVVVIIMIDNNGLIKYFIKFV